MSFLEHPKWTEIGAIGTWISAPIAVIGILLAVIGVYHQVYPRISSDAAQHVGIKKEDDMPIPNDALTPESLKQVHSEPAYISVQLNNDSKDWNYNDFFAERVNDEVKRLSPLIKDCISSVDITTEEDGAFTFTVRNGSYNAYVVRKEISTSNNP